MTLLICGWDEGLLRRLLARRAELVLVLDRAESDIPTVAELAPQLRGLHVVTSLELLSELAAVAVSEQLAGTAFAEVVGATEPAQLAAGYLAALLTGDLASLDRSVRLRDKRAMKERLRAAGVRVARQITIEAGLDPESVLDRIEQQLGWPAVIKPVAGTGTLHTAVLPDRSAAAEHLGGAGAVGTLMAEQYVRGAEFHVDGVWQDGEPRILGVSRYIVPRVELGGAGRDNGSALLAEPENRELYRQVEQLHRAANDALGIATAITHLEVFLDAEGTLWFSEIAGRVGGGGVNRVYENADLDLREEFADVLTGRARPAATRHPERLLGWIHLAPDGPGRIGTVPDEAALEQPWVRIVQRCVADGAQLAELSLMDWVCIAVFDADSWPQYLTRARTLEERGRELMATS